MEKSPTISELAKALVKFQSEVDPILFDADNPFYKSKYATQAALVKATREILCNNGLAVLQPLEDTNSVITILLHTSGEFIQTKLTLTPVKNDPQGQGSTITYSRRYAYSAILGLVSERDDDGNEASGIKEPPKDNTALLPTMMERIIAEGKKKFKTSDEFTAWRVDHKLVEKLNTATEAQLTYVWAVLREKK